MGDGVQRLGRSLITAVALTAAACGGGGGGTSAADRCESEFAAAEKVPPSERRPGMLADAAVACKDRDTWIEVANRHPDTLGGKNAVDALAALCFGAIDARLANAKICENL